MSIVVALIAIMKDQVDLFHGLPFFILIPISLYTPMPAMQVNVMLFVCIYRLHVSLHKEF